MKYLMILTIGVGLLLSSIPAMADQTADEAAIRKAAKELNATWSEKDLDAHMALIDDNFVMNDVEKGKAAHRERLEQLWASEDYSQVKHSEQDVVFLTSDVAIYRINGLRVEWNRKVIIAWIFSKKGGNWLLSAAFWQDVEE